MTSTAAEKQLTGEAFMTLSRDGHRYEFVNGEVIDMGNSGMEYDYITCILSAVLTHFVRNSKLGAVSQQ
jgi:Uma2 family endonuclease